MFSRISVALKKANAVTLDDLVKVILESFTPTPLVNQVNNIHDVKSWQRAYIPTLKYRSHPHAFRFKLNDHGEVEMSYRNWAKSKRKEWLPLEGPIIIMRELPPRKPSLLKPDLKKCPSVAIIRDAISKLKVRMSLSELQWWEKMANQEEKRVDIWNSLNDKQYVEAGRASFDLFEIKYREADPVVEETLEEYQKREVELERLLPKKNSQFQVTKLICTKKT